MKISKVFLILWVMIMAAFIGVLIITCAKQ